MNKSLFATLIGVAVFNMGVIAQIHVKNNGVGIGTSTPTEKLHVAGKTLIEATDNVLNFNSPDNAWQYLTFNKNGQRKAYFGLNQGTDVSIRIEQPGDIYMQPISGRVVIESQTDAGNIGGTLVLDHPGKTGGYNVARQWAIFNMTGTYGNGLQFWAYGQGGCATMCRPAVTFADNGNVGIGVFPGYKLTVDGDARATKFIADVNTYADYVFDSTYQLPSISEVEKYIKENHHLPEVPSEQEVKKNGINLGDHQVVLLKKIEELTLYVIEQHKKIEALEAKMKAMEEKGK